MARILIVEDNESIREAVCAYLRLSDHEVLEFAMKTDVLEVMRHKTPDLVILDVMLPDGNGFDLAKKIKNEFDVPFIFLTAKDRESDRILGFELGADDYVIKPFSPKELMLRVEAVLRRTSRLLREEYFSWNLDEHHLVMDPGKHMALYDDKTLQLTGAEWKILYYLASRFGMVVSREQILGDCLGYSYEGSERTVDTHVKNIRAKLGVGNSWIETVRGFGYRFLGKSE